MIDQFIAGIGRGFGAFGWCLSFIGGWVAVAAVLITASAIVMALRGNDGGEDDDDV